jgi:hypothetical protein
MTACRPGHEQAEKKSGSQDLQLNKNLTFQAVT